MSETYVYLIREPDWDSDAYLEGGEDLSLDDDFSAHVDFERAVAELGARVVGGKALQSAKYGGVTTPGPRGQEREQAVHTDSPYADSSELITGFYVVEVDDETTAREVAAMVPSGGTVEWRKVFPME